jgi:hypothetical protein
LEKTGTSSGIWRCLGAAGAVKTPPANRLIEGTMATRDEHRIVETPTEARQGEPGPSVAALLAVSLGLAVLVLAVVWFAFFRS